jgi:RNA polymerase sigma-70 factor (ECF subfamily)
MGGVRVLGWLVPVAEVETIDWEAVYREELPRVYNFFRYRVTDRATAEDLTSLTFEKAWRARDRYRRDRASAGTWLLAIARNVAIDHFRRRRPEIPLEDEQEAEGAPSESPEAQAVRTSELRRLGALLSALPARERELVALKYGAGATNRAIAKLTGLSESNVGTILHRTVGALRAAWDEGGRS